MDLRQLHYLVTVADAGGGIRKASRQLHLTQPSLSQALRQLEGEMGVQLMHRSTRGAELTDAGVELVDYADRFLDKPPRHARRCAGVRRSGRARSRWGFWPGPLRPAS